MDLICQLLSHIENVMITVLLVCLGAEEEGIGQCDRDDVLENSHIEGRTLESMTQNKEMHALVVGDGHGWVDLLFESGVLINLESVCDSIGSFVSDETFFEDEGCISLHVFYSSVFLTLLIDYDVELFDRLLVLTVQLDVHLDHFSGLARHHIVELASEVL